MMGELKLSLAAEVLVLYSLYYYLSLVIILIEDNTSWKLFINYHLYTLYTDYISSRLHHTLLTTHSAISNHHTASSR